MTEKRKASEIIPNLSDMTIEDFWAWAYSDIVSNTIRGVYGEFLVATAIGAVENVVRNAWWDYDLSYKKVKLEVKTSAYRQSWKQKQNSLISFDIKPKKRNMERTADIYVFCLFNETDDNKSHERVIDPAYWEFYIVPEKFLPNQKTLGLNSLHRICVNYDLSFPLSYDDILPKIKTIASDIITDQTNNY